MVLPIEFASEATGRVEDGTLIQRTGERVTISQPVDEEEDLDEEDMPRHYGEALVAAVHDLWTFEVEKRHGHLDLTEVTVTIRDLKVRVESERDPTLN